MTPRKTTPPGGDRPLGNNRPLGEYEHKRDFTRTPEPAGGQGTPPPAPSPAPQPGPAGQTVPPGGFPRFVVQEHHATHLHWDLRLEMDGVLKSWAVPKGPPLVKGVRRLAVQVEDHPLSYIDFEGMVPEGNYGAGSVSIWDNGPYALAVNRPDMIEFAALGQKMQGGYVLVHTRENQWLLMKTASGDGRQKR